MKRSANLRAHGGLGYYPPQHLFRLLKMFPHTLHSHRPNGLMSPLVGRGRIHNIFTSFSLGCRIKGPKRIRKNRQNGTPKVKTAWRNIVGWQTSAKMATPPTKGLPPDEISSGGCRRRNGASLLPKSQLPGEISSGGWGRRNGVQPILLGKTNLQYIHDDLEYQP